MIELSLCNELLAADGHDLVEQCHIAAALGYVGLELAPATLTSGEVRPHELDAGRIRAIRRTVEAAGLRVTGLHWLLAPYPELSITEPAKRQATEAVLVALVRQCADLGGRVLVHGSPAQRRLPDGQDVGDVLDAVVDLFGAIALEAERVGVIYCIEPLARTETAFLNTVDEALSLVDAVGSSAFRTMIDTSAAAASETLSVADLMRRHLTDSRLAHVQLNDSNRGAPGTGNDPFEDIVAALRDCAWPHPPAIEPFVNVHDATATAAIAMATVRAHERHLQR